MRPRFCSCELDLVLLPLLGESECSLRWSGSRLNNLCSISGTLLPLSSSASGHFARETWDPWEEFKCICFQVGLGWYRGALGASEDLPAVLDESSLCPCYSLARESQASLLLRTTAHELAEPCSHGSCSVIIFVLIPLPLPFSFFPSLTRLCLAQLMNFPFFSSSCSLPCPMGRSDQAAVWCWAAAHCQPIQLPQYKWDKDLSPAQGYQDCYEIREHLIWREAEWAGVVCPRESLRSILPIFVNTWRKGKVREPGSVQWCLGREEKAVGANLETGGSMWLLRKSSLWGWLRSGTGCPEAVGSSPWTSPKAAWMQGWAQRYLWEELLQIDHRLLFPISPLKSFCNCRWAAGCQDEFSYW